MHLLVFSALLAPAKVRDKTSELREPEEVVASELINGADGTTIFLQTHSDLAETSLILDGLLALGSLVILPSVWSAAVLDNLVCGYH